MVVWRLLSLAPLVSLAFGPGSGPVAKHPSPTFAKDIAPILYKRCASCHSESNIAPFSLVGYENARARAKTIAKITELGLMPPWKASLHYGEFKDVPVLSAEERRLIAEWANDGAPEGNPADEPLPPKVVPGWRLGKPNCILTPAKLTKIPPEGGDFYRDYLVDPHITQPTWVSAVDFRPMQHGTVHHIIPILVNKENADKCRKVKFDHDDDSWEQDSLESVRRLGTFGFWSTGAPPFVAPQNSGFLIQPGDCFLLDIHYKTTGKPEVEQPQVALYFAKETPKDKVTVDVISSGDIYVQPGQKDARFFALGEKFETASTIYAVWPHMHYLGRTFKAWIKYPVGYSKPLVCINDWDPDWQLIYYLKTPMEVPAGSKVYVTGTYDNSTDNLRNPHSPPEVMEGGESSKDEMLFFEVFKVNKTPAKKS
jgi:hypothetical protein